MRHRRTRWASIVVLLMACVAASPQAVRPRPISDVGRLLGSWNCDGYAPGSTSVETYSRQSDGSVLLSNSVHTSVGASGIVIETLVFDPMTSTWSVTAAPNPLFDGLQLTGPVWTDRKWILSGTETVRKAPRPVRIVYTDLGPNSFRREHQTQVKGDWVDDGEFVCARVGTAPFVFATPGAARKGTMLHQAVAGTPVPTYAARRVSDVTTTPAPTPTTTPPRSVAATARATAAPTHVPTVAPTRTPTVAPTRVPTIAPTRVPTAAPTAMQTRVPTSAPTRTLIVAPTAVPTAAPSAVPAAAPSATPAVAASATPANAQSAGVSSPVGAAHSQSLPANAEAALKSPPAAKVASAPRHASPKPNPDYAYGLLGPAWSCETVGGIPSTHTYVLESDGSITMRNALRIGTHDYLLVEHYRFNAEHARWTTALERGGYSGTASEWLGPKWIFNGVETTKGRDAPVRMIYTKLGAQAYRRDFQLESGDTTRTLESETCQRG